MPQHASSALRRLTRTQKLSVAGVAAAGAAALVFTTVPGTDADQGTAQATTVDVKPVAFSAVGTAAQAQQATIAKQADSSAAKGKAEAAAKKAAAVKAAKAKVQAEKARATKAAANRSAVRTAIPAAAKPAVKPVPAKTAAKPAAKTYPDNLDGWIRESLAIMAKKGIPGSYEGIHRNIMRESSGNPMAINNWDINAINGTPSKGLLQVIAPTFKTYHVEGTSWNLYDPVANITAACNYAAAKYGSMDNVNSAY